MPEEHESNVNGDTDLCGCYQADNNNNCQSHRKEAQAWERLVPLSRIGMIHNIYIDASDPTYLNELRTLYRVAIQVAMQSAADDEFAHQMDGI